MEFLQVDVFTDAPFRGNPLAVFPDASGLDAQQGVEMGRPSRIRIKAGDEDVQIGGSCELVFEGKLATVP